LSTYRHYKQLGLILKPMPATMTPALYMDCPAKACDNDDQRLPKGMVVFDYVRIDYPK